MTQVDASWDTNLKRNDAQERYYLHLVRTSTQLPLSNDTLGRHQLQRKWNLPKVREIAKEQASYLVVKGLMSHEIQIFGDNFSGWQTAP